MLMPVVAEQECDTIDSRKTDQRVNDSGDECKIWTENGSNQIEIENSNQAPVQTSDNHQDEYNFFQSYHSFRMYFATKLKKYDIIFLSMQKSMEIVCRGYADENRIETGNKSGIYGS